MALKKQIALNGVELVLLENGMTINKKEVLLNFPDAYHRVSSMSGNKDHQNAVVETLSSAGGFTVCVKEFSNLPWTLDGGNNLAQAYNALKNLPEFADSEDV